MHSIRRFGKKAKGNCNCRLWRCTRNAIIFPGYYNEKLKLTDFETLVGGLPKVKKWLFTTKRLSSPTYPQLNENKPNQTSRMIQIRNGNHAPPISPPKHGGN
jgi:hypothetical protein